MDKKLNFKFIEKGNLNELSQKDMSNVRGGNAGCFNHNHQSGGCIHDNWGGGGCFFGNHKRKTQ